MRTDEEILQEAEYIMEMAEAEEGDFRDLMHKFEDAALELLNLLRESINNHKNIV